MIVDITLTCDAWGSQIQPQVFHGQEIGIYPVSNTPQLGADGHFSEAQHATRVVWTSGMASQFDNITNVIIASSDGTVVLQGEINRTYNDPADKAYGVEFFVF